MEGERLSNVGSVVSVHGRSYRLSDWIGEKQLIDEGASAAPRADTARVEEWQGEYNLAERDA